MLASESSSMSVVEVLVQRGAVLQAVDSLGHDVLHYAKLSGSSEIRAVLTAELHSAHSDSGEIGTVFSTDRAYYEAINQTLAGPSDLISLQIHLR